MRRRAVVVGGSLGGLTAALLLREAGFEVSVHERSAQLADRGAGIIAHPDSLRYLLERGLASLDEVSIPGGNLRYVDRDGRMASDHPSGYRFTSWSALYTRLLDCLPHGAMHFGQMLSSFVDDGDAVTAHFSGAEQQRCDLLVCADGIASAARRLLLPAIELVYSGYIGWRGTVPVAALDSRLRAALGDHITYQLLDAGHTLAYPIPDSRGGQSGDGTALNWIWYRRRAGGDEVTRAMTDSGGQHHDLSVPPGAVAATAVAELREAAARLLSDNLAALVLATQQPFIQRVVDVEVPRMAFGRVCLLGDAAFVARPHAAAGTAKAAADGWSLAAAMAATDDVADGLLRWQPGQLELGRSLVRRSGQLGDTQFRGEWTPGDPSLRFGLRVAGDSCFDLAGAVTGGVRRARGPAPDHEGDPAWPS
jgi:2,6-dihydroxypyridine 3-monooxygenase